MGITNVTGEEMANPGRGNGNRNA